MVLRLGQFCARRPWNALIGARTVILAGAGLECVSQHVQRRKADLAGTAHGTRQLGDGMSCLLRDRVERLNEGVLMAGMSTDIHLILNARSRECRLMIRKGREELLDVDSDFGRASNTVQRTGFSQMGARRRGCVSGHERLGQCRFLFCRRMIR